MVSNLESPRRGNICFVALPGSLEDSWSKAICSGAPDTPSSYPVSWNTKLFPPLEDYEQVANKVVLVNFGAHTTTQDCVKWGRKHGLIPAHPLHCLAVASWNSELPWELGLEYMRVLSLKECSLEGRTQAFFVLIEPMGVRAANTDETLRVWDKSFWLAYISDSKIPTKETSEEENRHG